MPLLYTFRRCPYAIRARLAIFASGVEVVMQEVDLRNKPPALLACSAKGTVPVLQLDNGEVLEESLHIMQWALAIDDPMHWQIDVSDQALAFSLIEKNDGEFKFYLDRYKYADRFPEHSRLYYRQQAEVFLEMLSDRLNQHRYLMGARLTWVDMAIFPFIRQFAQVDRAWFDTTSYRRLQQWLAELLQSSFFEAVMKKM